MREYNNQYKEYADAYEPHKPRQYHGTIDLGRVPVFVAGAAVIGAVITNEPPKPTPQPEPEPIVEAVASEPAPTYTPTPEPTAEPTPEPTPDNTPEPTPRPTARPTVIARPTPAPTPVPTEEPIQTPEPTPEPTATPEPSSDPTPEPTPNPTPTPEPTPTPTPTPEIDTIGTVVPGMDDCYFINPQVTIQLPSGTAGSGKLRFELKNPETGDYITYFENPERTWTWENTDTELIMDDLNFEVPLGDLPSSSTGHFILDYNDSDGESGSITSNEFEIVVTSGNFMQIESKEIVTRGEEGSFLEIRYLCNVDTADPVDLNTISLNSSQLCLNVTEGVYGREVELEGAPVTRIVETSEGTFYILEVGIPAEIMQEADTVELGFYSLTIIGKTASGETKLIRDES